MIVGINYNGMHDSAVGLLGDDGEVLMAISEERLSRVKKDGRWPRRALELVDLDRCELLAVPYLAETPPPAPRDDRCSGILLPASKSIDPYPARWRERIESVGLPVLYFDHHVCHARAAFVLSGSDEALVLTCDYGAYNCAHTLGLFHIDHGASTWLGGASYCEYEALCSLYSDVTAMLGFRPVQHEGKVTGLAARGRDSHECQRALWQVHSLARQSSSRLYDWVGFLEDDTPAWMQVDHLLATHYRGLLGEHTDADIACAAQRLYERKLVELASRLLDGQPADLPLLLSGGGFANVKANFELMRTTGRDVFVCPPMGDEGLAIGALGEAVLVEGAGVRLKRPPTLFLGAAVDGGREELERVHIRYRQTKSLALDVATELAEGRTVALACGREEFGPRALGNRSILRVADDVTVNDWLNKKLQRTEFMPFAPIIRIERASEAFQADDLAQCLAATRFMTICLPVTEQFAGLCPAVVHLDGTARPQVVRKEDHTLLHDILRHYEAMSGLPALINTSFNVHDEPIVSSSRDALRAFFLSQLDVLVIDDLLIHAHENASWTAAAAVLADSDQLTLEKRRREAVVLHLGERRLRDHAVNEPMPARFPERYVHA